MQIVDSALFEVRQLFLDTLDCSAKVFCIEHHSQIFLGHFPFRVFHRDFIAPFQRWFPIPIGFFQHAQEILEGIFVIVE